jgi:hypothetical protein
LEFFGYDLDRAVSAIVAIKDSVDSSKDVFVQRNNHIFINFKSVGMSGNRCSIGAVFPKNLAFFC